MTTTSAATIALPPIKPGQQCRVCAHVERDAIDKALVAGDGMDTVARRFSLKRDAVWRHRRNHIPAAVVGVVAAEREAHTADLVAVAAEREAHTAAHVLDLMDTVTKLLGDAREILEKAKAEGDPRTALLGIREATRVCDLLGRMRGEIDTAPTINLTVQPIMVEFQQVVLSALTAFPDARRAVLESLSALDGPPVLQIGHTPAEPL